MINGWNYASSAEQNKAELLEMYKSLTDPLTRKKLSIEKRREERANLIKQDAGL